MGLDLTLMRKSDYEDIVSEKKKWEDKMELAYGRKTWVIANYFSMRSVSHKKSEYVKIITRETWEEFYKTVSPYYDEIEELSDEMVNLFEYESDDEFEEIDPNYRENRYRKLDKKLSNIIEKCLGCSDFTLGSDWEGRAILRWLDANDNIIDAYNKGEEIVMILDF